MVTKNRWSVKRVEAWSVKTDRNSISSDAHSAFKIQRNQRTAFSENCTQENLRRIISSRVKIPQFHSKERPKPFQRGEKRSNQAARPISISPLNGLLRLHA